MDRAVVRTFVAEVGFRTRAEIQSQFQAENQEILDGILTNLLERSDLRKISFMSPGGNSEILYYILS